MRQLPIDHNADVWDAKYVRQLRTTGLRSKAFDSIDDLKMLEKYKNKIDAINYAIGIRPTDGNGVNDLGDMGQIAPEFANDKNKAAYTYVDDIIKTYIDFVGRHHEVFNEAIRALYTEYGHDTVDGIINRIKKTEYKRHRMPLVIPRNKYENFN